MICRISVRQVSSSMSMLTVLHFAACDVVILQEYFVFRKQVLWNAVTHKNDVCKILVAVALFETCANCFHAHILQLTTRLAANLKI